MYDVTAGGSCPGASCFSHTWQVGSIPSLVNGTYILHRLYFGCGSGSPQEPTQFPLYVKSWSYTVNSPTSNPSLTAWNAGTTTNNGTISAASPIYSVAPGTYSSTQSVSLQPPHRAHTSATPWLRLLQHSILSLITTGVALKGHCILGRSLCHPVQPSTRWLEPIGGLAHPALWWRGSTR